MVTVESVNAIISNMFETLSHLRTDTRTGVDKVHAHLQQSSDARATLQTSVDTLAKNVKAILGHTSTLSHRLDVIEASLNSLSDTVSKRTDSSNSSVAPEPSQTQSSDTEAEFEDKLRQHIHAFADATIELHLNSTLEKGNILKSWNSWFPDETHIFHIDADHSGLFHKLLSERIGQALMDGSGRKRRYQQVRWKLGVCEETIAKALGVKRRVSQDGAEDADDTEDEEPVVKRVKRTRGYSGQLSADEVLRLRQLLGS